MIAITTKSSIRVNARAFNLEESEVMAELPGLSNISNGGPSEWRPGRFIIMVGPPSSHQLTGNIEIATWPPPDELDGFRRGLGSIPIPARALGG